MPTRTFDEPDTTFPFHTEVTNSLCKVVYDFESAALLRRKRGGKVGANTPNYYGVLKVGDILPLNSYKRWDYTFEAYPGQRTWQNLAKPCWGGSNSLYTYVPLWVIGEIPGPSMCINDPFEGVDTMLLLTKALADIAPDLDILTTAAEAAKTGQMVLEARDTAKRLITQARRGGFHTAKAAANAWLQWRYGWQTLGYDLAAIYNLVKEPFNHLIVTGQAGESVTTPLSGAGIRGERTEGHYAYTYEGQIDTSLRARITAKWTGHTVNVLADPLVTAWELVPYSWVADWFVSVGDTLRAWSVLAKVTDVHASLGWHTTAQAEIQEHCVPAAGWSHDGQWSWSERFESKGRYPVSIPFIVPSITVNLTTPRLLDVAALCAKRIF
jgi:hypothetical protein